MKNQVHSATTCYRVRTLGNTAQPRRHMTFNFPLRLYVTFTNIFCFLQTTVILVSTLFILPLYNYLMINLNTYSTDFRQTLNAKT